MEKRINVVKSLGSVAQISFLLQIASLGLWLRQSGMEQADRVGVKSNGNMVALVQNCLRPFPRVYSNLRFSLRKRIWVTAPESKRHDSAKVRREGI